MVEVLVCDVMLAPSLALNNFDCHKIAYQDVDTFVAAAKVAAVVE